MVQEDEAALLRERYPLSRLFVPIRTWLAGGNNMGIKEAAAIFFLNNDTFVHDGSISCLVDRMKRAIIGDISQDRICRYGGRYPVCRVYPVEPYYPAESTGWLPGTRSRTARCSSLNALSAWCCHAGSTGGYRESGCTTRNIFPLLRRTRLERSNSSEGIHARVSSRGYDLSPGK